MAGISSGRASAPARGIFLESFASQPDEPDYSPPAQQPDAIVFAQGVTLRRLEDELGVRDTARDVITFTAPPEAANVFLLALEAARLQSKPRSRPGRAPRTRCAFHHQRGIHARTMRCSGRAPEGLVFELGVRANGPPLLRARAGDVLLSA